MPIEDAVQKDVPYTRNQDIKPLPAIASQDIYMNKPSSDQATVKFDRKIMQPSQHVGAFNSRQPTRFGLEMPRHDLVQPTAIVSSNIEESKKNSQTEMSNFYEKNVAVASDDQFGIGKLPKVTQEREAGIGIQRNAFTGPARASDAFIKEMVNIPNDAVKDKKTNSRTEDIKDQPTSENKAELMIEGNRMPYPPLPFMLPPEPLNYFQREYQKPRFNPSVGNFLVRKIAGRFPTKNSRRLRGAEFRARRHFPLQAGRMHARQARHNRKRRSIGTKTKQHNNLRNIQERKRSVATAKDKNKMQFVKHRQSNTQNQIYKRATAAAKHQQKKNLRNIQEHKRSVATAKDKNKMQFVKHRQSNSQNQINKRANAPAKHQQKKNALSSGNKRAVAFAKRQKSTAHLSRHKRSVVNMKADKNNQQLFPNLRFSNNAVEQSFDSAKEQAKHAYDPHRTIENKFPVIPESMKESYAKTPLPNVHDNKNTLTRFDHLTEENPTEESHFEVKKEKSTSNKDKHKVGALEKIPLVLMDMLTHLLNPHKNNKLVKNHAFRNPSMTDKKIDPISNILKNIAQLAKISFNKAIHSTNNKESFPKKVSNSGKASWMTDKIDVGSMDMEVQIMVDDGTGTKDGKKGVGIEMVAFGSRPAFQPFQQPEPILEPPIIPFLSPIPFPPFLPPTLNFDLKNFHNNKPKG